MPSSISNLSIFIFHPFNVSTFQPFNLLMFLPSDPDMLVSAINMMLRNGEYSDLEDLCACADRDIEELKATLLAHGYAFDGKQFR